MAQANLQAIYEDIQHGNMHNTERLHDAIVNLHYYRGHFSPYHNLNHLGIQHVHRTSMFLKFIVDHISNLYKDNPNRCVIGFDEATKWLQQIYNDNKMEAKWHGAEQLTAVSDLAAFQVAGTANPKKPIKITLWSADCLMVYLDPDDCLIPNAVVTMDRYEGRKRYQVWTDSIYAVLMGEREGSSLREAIKVTEEANPYGGRIPFSFLHYNYPCLEFHSGGPGTSLRHANHYINHVLSQLGGSVMYALNPILLAYDVAPEFRPPDVVKPGQMLTPSGAADANGTELPPRFEYLQPNYGYVDATWTDLLNFINNTLECSGVPESSVRMIQSVARSGVSIQAEQYPLIQWAKSRQPMYRHYEYDLAELVFQVASAHFSKNKVVKPIVRLAAEKGFELSVTYHTTYSDVPGPEQDRAADWAVLNGYQSKVQIQMQRTGCTKEEALAHFVEVEEDNQDLAKILTLPVPGSPEEIAAAESIATQEEEDGSTTGSNQTATGTENSDDSSE
jgi:hypothetical protein